MESFTNLGGKPKEPDHRDHLVGSATATGYTYPPTFHQVSAWSAPIYYQGQRPACGAHAGTWAKVLLDLNQGQTGANYTPRFTWVNIKRDGSSPSDGTDMRTIFNTLTRYGADQFEPLENDVTFNDQQYASTAALTPTMLTDGQGRTIASYAFPTDKTFEGIKQAIWDNKHVVLLIRVCGRFWQNAQGISSWSEKDILPLAPPSSAFPVIDGHFIVAHSYDENNIYFANSFGPTWGRGGHGYFTKAYMPWVVELGIMRNPPTPPPEVSVPTQQAEVTQLTVQKVALLTQLLNMLRDKLTALGIKPIF